MKRILTLFFVLVLIVHSGFSQDQPAKTRNVKTVGLLIGGSLVGFDYEFRTNDYLGIQAGFGIVGYDLALNWHFENTVEGSYLSLA